MGVIVSDRRTLIVGLGKTGLSCVRYLAAQGRKLAVADTRKAPPGLAELQTGWPDVEVHLGAFDSDFFSAFSELIVSPGVLSLIHISEPTRRTPISYAVFC